jgi:multidrug efflux pump subunit AcrA (membrane-fusion protein)
MQVRKLLIPVFFVALLSLAGCGARDSESNLETASTASLAQELEDVVSATGEVRPARWASLSFPVAGRVATVHVEEGQDVSAGQSLSELDSVQLARAVAEAEAALLAARANLARVQAGAHPQDIAAAEEAVAAAKANVGVAQTQVDAAEAGLGQVQTGVNIAEAQVAIAQAGVKVAQAEVGRAQSSISEAELEVARAALDKARAAVRTAQAEYDRIGGASDTPQALALEQATLDVEMAQSEYNRVADGPRASDLAPLRAGVEAAQAQVALAQAQVDLAKRQIIQAEVAVAQAQAAREAAQTQVAQARATLHRLRAGATPEEVAVAEAAVSQAWEALASAEAVHSLATLTAPFDGTIGLIYVRQGEEVIPGQSVLVMGDLTTLRVETTDLDEYDVARIEPGQRVDLTFDALPEKVLPGRVIRVAPMSTPGQAATTYTVIIDFEESDPALLWGMTAFVDIWME